MNYFINKIKVNKIFHLENFEIPIANEKAPHLIITGKNGSGKTILINAIADFLEMVRKDESLGYLEYEYRLSNANNRAATAPADIHSKEIFIEHWQDQVHDAFGRVDIKFKDVYEIARNYKDGQFLFAYYSAYRKPQMNEPKNPTKPVINKITTVRDSSTSQFLNFLSDLKIQEALARNEKLISEADIIKEWFVSFEQLLSQIYEDSNLKLNFDYKDYSFRINVQNKSFKFTELSDGYAAIIDIIADLILKMQSGNSAMRAYEKQGIVIIDEIETHLHLALQKIILPILTKVFPNIQFIITTHSPFVLSSLPDAIAFDLEKKEVIDELTEYSYEALAEGYFGVKTESSYIEAKIERLKKLLEKNELGESEKIELKNIYSEFESLSEMISPTAKGSFLTLKINYSNKISSLGL